MSKKPKPPPRREPPREPRPTSPKPTPEYRPESPPPGRPSEKSSFSDYLPMIIGIVLLLGAIAAGVYLFIG